MNSHDFWREESKRRKLSKVKDDRRTFWYYFQTRQRQAYCGQWATSAATQMSDRGDDRGTDSGNNLALLLDVLGVGEEEADSINNAPLGVNEFTDLLLSCGARDSLTLDRTRRLATNKFAEAEESTVGLIDLFDEVIADIAHYLLPPDVYNLCLTSKRFHRPTTLPTSPEYLELGGNTPGALLSTRLLRISLLDR